MKILIIEDDTHILSFLTRGFEEDGYVVDSATDGADGEYLALMHTYDVILLDWMLPSKNGLEIIHSLRENNIRTPTIMLSAKGETKDKVSGLKSGADDYLYRLLAYLPFYHRLCIVTMSQRYCHPHYDSQCLGI